MRTDLSIDGQYLVRVVAEHLAAYPNVHGPVYPCDELPAFLPRLPLENWTRSWDIYSSSVSTAIRGMYPNGQRYCLAGNVAKLEKCKYLEGLEASEIPFRFKTGDLCMGADCDAMGMFLYKLPNGGDTNAFSTPNSTTTFVYAMQEFTNRELYCSNTFAQFANGIFFGTPFPQTAPGGGYAVIAYFPVNSKLMSKIHVPYIYVSKPQE